MNGLLRGWQWFGDRVEDRLAQRVPLNPVFRIGVASVLLMSGVAFLVLGGWLIFTLVSGTAKAPHPVAAALAPPMTEAMGFAFSYVGWRLLKMRTLDDELLGPRARLIGASFIALAAVGVMREAVLAGGVSLAVSAIGGALFSLALFRSVLSRRSAQRRAMRMPPVTLQSNR